jgi:sugar phosphate isomerase/epimerase
MKLAIVSDEISLDFREAVKHGINWSVNNFELRNFKSGRVPNIPDEEIENILTIKDDYNINISAISPGLFRISLQEEEQLKQELEEHVYNSFRFAEKVGTHNVVISGFKRYPNEPETNYIQIIHILNRMEALGKKYGFQLLLKNEPGFWCDTAENTAKVLEEINSKYIRAAWDPAYAFASGEIPYPYGFLTIRKFLHFLYAKDAKRINGNKVEWTIINKGEIDWIGQFQAVMQGVDLQYITIETHCKPLIESSQMNVRQITETLEDYALDDSHIIR